MAVAWCCENGKGSKAALANKEKFPLLTQGILDYALKKERQRREDPVLQSQIPPSRGFFTSGKGL